jgi:energy-coupling factor transporter ATP-binding protein EcfA2
MTNPKDHWETPQILSDLPLRSPEKAHFHFEEFAVTLARLIADPGTRTPLTIGISGPWGSGKTTLLQRVQHLLKPAKPKERSAYLNADETPEQFRMCKTVWFEAWKYNDEDKILVALVRNILVAMKKDGLFNKLKAEHEDPDQPTYDLLGLFINAFQFKFGGLGTEVQIKFDPEKFAKESPFVTHTAFFDYFDEAFSRLMALWVHNTVKEEKIEDQKGALVVFIDDLDRCLPEKTVQVLEAVKLFLDKPGCVFVLGAHTEVVQQAIVKHYTDSGVSVDNASDYLEKIIQLRFELPPILEDQMGDYLTTQGLPTESLDNWETIVAGAEINPRKVKTFLNDLNLAWALLVNSGQAQDVNRSDFTHWQVLMRAAPDSFRKHVYDLDNPAIRFQYIQRALAWVTGDEQAKEYFKDYEKYGRLKRTLQKIGAFSPQFDAKTLDAFIHLVAPPKPPIMEKILTEAGKSPGTTQQDLGLLESQPSAGEEKFPEKIQRGETLPHPGEIWFAGMSFLPIPKGEFLMGSRENDPQASDDEKLQHTVNIS